MKFKPGCESEGLSTVRQRTQVLPPSGIKTGFPFYARKRQMTGQANVNAIKLKALPIFTAFTR
jgi:hypothetical protein